MKPNERQKMCPNCDGRIPFEAQQCPYCFATVPQENGTPFKNQSIQDSLTSLYTPPYQAKSSSHEDKKAEPSYHLSSEKKGGSMAVELSSSEAVEKSGVEVKQFWPILSLSVGGNLFTLAVLQFFFSEGGIVKLELNAGYWFLWLLVSLPLFYFGLKQLQPKNDS